MTDTSPKQIKRLADDLDRLAAGYPVNGYGDNPGFFALCSETLRALLKERDERKPNE